jgi:hypothetical protein
VQLTPEQAQKLKQLLQGLYETYPIVSNDNGADYCFFCSRPNTGGKGVNHSETCEHRLAQLLYFDLEFPDEERT